MEYDSTINPKTGMWVPGWLSAASACARIDMQGLPGCVEGRAYISQEHASVVSRLQASSAERSVHMLLTPGFKLLA